MSDIEHTTYILDPDKTYQELETASADRDWETTNKNNYFCSIH